MGACSGANPNHELTLVSFKGTKNQLLSYDPSRKEMLVIPIFYDSATPFLIQLRKYTLFSSSFLLVAGGFVQDDYFFNMVLDLEARGLSPCSPFPTNRVYLFDLACGGDAKVTAIDKKNKNVSNLSEPRFDHTVFESVFHGSVFAAFGLDKNFENLYSLEFLSVFEMSLPSIRRDNYEDSEDEMDEEGSQEQSGAGVARKVAFRKKSEGPGPFISEKMENENMEKYIKKPRYKKHWDKITVPKEVSSFFKDTRNPCTAEIGFRDKKLIVFLFPADLFAGCFRLLLLEMEVGYPPAFETLSIQGPPGLVDYFLTSFGLVDSGKPNKLFLFGLGKKESWVLKCFQVDLAEGRIEFVTGVEVDEKPSKENQKELKGLASTTRISLGILNETVFLIISQRCVARFSLKLNKFSMEFKI